MSPGKVGFVSLGCAKATVDSERILTELRVQGYQMTARYGLRFAGPRCLTVAHIRLALKADTSIRVTRLRLSGHCAKPRLKIARLSPL